VGTPVHILGVVDDETRSPQNVPAVEALSQAASAVLGMFTRIKPDSSDVTALAWEIQATAKATAAGEGDRWRDEGYWLLIVMAGIGALWFRRGWVL
jgi:Ca-activated chloride channel family protein